MNYDEPHQTARERIASVYLPLMTEVVVRLEAMADTLIEIRSNPAHPNVWRNAEFCYLQLRKVCECTALAVLSSHEFYDDLGTAVQKKWHPVEIFEHLQRLNPYALPVGIEIHLDYHGPGQHHVEPTAAELTLADLKEIYAACGDRLHIGSLKRIVDGKLPPFNMNEIMRWRNTLVKTLNTHMIRLPHVGSVLLVTLKSEDDGQAHCTFADAEGPFAIEGDPSVFAVDKIL